MRKVCQSLAAGRWFLHGTPVSSTNKTDRLDINEILLKVTLNTMTITLTQYTKNYITDAVMHISIDMTFSLLTCFLFFVEKEKNNEGGG